jgi:hypothetical protein
MDSKIFILLFVLGVVASQLSNSDKTYMKNSILSTQDETTALFNKSYSTTYLSVFSLQSLDVQVPNATKICRELSFEVDNPAKLEVLELSKLLNCKLTFTNQQQLANYESVSNIHSLYESLLISEHMKAELKWEDVYSTLKKFYFDDKFTQSANSTDVSLKSSSEGLDILVMVYKKIKADIETKKQIKEKIMNVSSSIIGDFQVLVNNVY